MIKTDPKPDAKPFFGFLPTEPDVKRLMDEFSDLQEEARVSFAVLEQILKIDKKSYRFRTVVNTWRNRMFNEKNMYIKNIRGFGYEVATPQQRVAAGAEKINRGVRATVRGLRILETTDSTRLSSEYRVILEHNMKRAAAITLAEMTQQKKLQPPVF